MTVFTRRTVVGGAVAATAVGAIETPARAADLDDFINMSAVLIGISKDKLSPFVDPINVKQAYFDKAHEEQPAFDRLLQIFRANPPPADAAEIILNHSGSDIRYLARSIMLAWYLGAWYDPGMLQQYDSRDRPKGPIPFKVISPAAYTQGWAWRVAQAHPMGYSDLTFGYWKDLPPPLKNFTGV
jgi:hypothetical protein